MSSSKMVYAPTILSPEIVLDNDYWWLTDPLNPGDVLQLHLAPGSFVTGDNFPQQVIMPLGRVDPVVLFDTPKLPSFTLALVFLTDGAKQQFDNMRALQHALLLQGPAPVGQWYIILGTSKSDSLMLSSLRGRSTTGGAIYDVTITVQAVAAP